MVKPEIVVSPDYKSCHHQPNDIYMIAWSFPLFKYAAMKCMVSLSLLALLGISGYSALFTKGLPAHDGIHVGNYLKDHYARVNPPAPATCPYHPNPIPLPSPLPANISKALTNLSESLKLIVNETTGTGVVAAVAYRGEALLSVGYGTIKKGSKTIPNGDTIFRVGSISKIFAVFAMYQLMDRGYIKSLDDPLTDYCPNFSIKNPYDLENVVTLRQMASELSGLPDNPPCTPNILTRNICPGTTDEILSKLKDQYLAMTAWTRPSYSNLAYALLGRCIVQHYNSLITFEKYVEDNILKPLNMTSTGFDYTSQVKSRMATGYDANGNEAFTYDLGWAAPAGQMYSTVNDLMKFAEFFNSYGKGGKILSPHLVKEMLLPAFIDYDLNTVFGSPWEMLLEKSYLIVSKGGSVTGYSGFFSFIPQLQLSYVVLQNTQALTPGIVELPYAVLLDAFVPYLSDNQPKYPSPPNPEAYIGNYKDQFGVLNLTVYEHDNSGQLMVMVLPTLPVYLSYKGDGLFQTKLPSLLSCIFYEVIAVNNEWVYFDKVDSSGKSPGFLFPGVYGLDKFHRA